jgi:hypothetical protein
MAESFRNFNGEIAVTSTSSVVIVPYGVSGSGYGNTSTSGNRDLNSVVQIHSIYISQVPSSKIKGTDRYNPKNFSAFNLKIIDKSDNDTQSGTKNTYIVFDGRVVPGSPFFIEKNITLDPKQCLVIECPNNSYDIDIKNNSNNVQLNTNANDKLHFTASAVLFPDANS